MRAHHNHFFPFSLDSKSHSTISSLTFIVVLNSDSKIRQVRPVIISILALQHQLKATPIRGGAVDLVLPRYNRQLVRYVPVLGEDGEGGRGRGDKWCEGAKSDGDRVIGAVGEGDEVDVPTSLGDGGRVGVHLLTADQNSSWKI